MSRKLAPNRVFEIEIFAQIFLSSLSRPLRVNNIFILFFLFNLDEIPWNKPCHIKLHGSDLYLTISVANKLTDRDTEVTLVSGQKRDSPNTMWILESVNKESEHVTYGCFIRVISCTKAWLHCDVDNVTSFKPQPVCI